MRGQRTRYPAWSFFALLDSNAPEEIKLLAGAALLQATTLGQPIKSKITARLCQLINHDGTQASSQDLNHARSYAGKLLADVAATYPLRKVKLQQLQLAARIRASLAGQLDAPNLDDRRACSTAREATTQECLEVGPLLKLRAEAGDGLAIAIVVAHCSGPVWDIVLDIPFSDAAPDDWAALIDVRQGIVKIDLGSVLPDLARALPGHEPASCVMQIPLPVFCADALQRSVSSNPNATCLRELFSLSQVTANTVLPGTPKDAPIKLSIARFVRARGTFAIWAGSLREVAAYATGDPVKVGKSSHHYVTIDLDEIWSCNATRYSRLQWGAPVERPGTLRMAVGSQATPTRETMQRIDKVFVDAFLNTKVGRRYTAASLIANHNTYARLCAHRAAFFHLARAAAAFSFHADELDESAESAILVDKRVGPFSGATQLPIPVRLAEQINLWKSHLVALAGRLDKLNAKQPGNPFASTVKRIQAILDGEHTRLFFLIDQDGRPQEFGSIELELQHPDVAIKADARRHFVVNALRKHGVPYSVATLLTRHHVEGLSIHEYDAPLAVQSALSQLASAMDQIAFDLGINPIAGLRRRVVSHGNAI